MNRFGVVDFDFSKLEPVGKGCPGGFAVRDLFQ